jgi:hypothetical protein
MTIRAELSSDSIASVPGSTIAAIGSSPVLALCRKLIEAGYPSSAPLNAYRGKTLCLRVLGIGEAAQLEINGEGSGFRPRSKPGSGSPVSVSSVAASS